MGLDHHVNQLVSGPGVVGGVLFASAVYQIGTFSTSWITNRYTKGLFYTLNVTNINGGTASTQIQEQDIISLNPITLSNGTLVLSSNTTGGVMIYPSLPTSSSTANNHIGYIWRLQLIIATA